MYKSSKDFYRKQLPGELRVAVRTFHQLTDNLKDLTYTIEALLEALDNEEAEDAREA